LPTITYIGATVYRKRPDRKDSWVRKEPVEVSQEWLDRYRVPICSNPSAFLVEGDANAEVSVDEGDDGIPDSGWVKKDISAWLTERGVELPGYATKSKLLALVEEHLNPPAAEPVAEEPAPAEEPTETPTGDE
tara:strand:- start:162 stop:560 length:399 start_codon:yes stop_codon:yes gene_type:complete